MQTNEENIAVYLKSLHLENFMCFKGEYTISLADKEAKPAQWTIFLGNNNTGKTSILKAIASIETREVSLADTKEIEFRKSDKDYVPKYPISKNRFGDNFYLGVELFVSKQLRSKLAENEYYKLRTYINPLRIRENGRKFFGHIYIINNGFGMINLDFESNVEVNLLQKYPFFKIYGYGTSRRASAVNNINPLEENESTIGLFSDDIYLINVEEWLLQLDYAVKNNASNAANRLEKIKNILTSEILPDVKDFRFVTTKNFKNLVEVSTDYGWVRIKELGYGYQATIAWLADLAKRMFDRYPELENPLHGPAIVLIDEIDLHLHPEWQRKIIKYLSDLFPNTQFIVTAHSPLIVQSAENVNLVMLEKDETTGSINVRQQFGSFQGWTVEEILRELMDLGEKTRSDRYLELMREFEDSLLEENYAGAKTAYEELDKILSPSSHQRKVLQIQMSSLIPA